MRKDNSILNIFKRCVTKVILSITIVALGGSSSFAAPAINWLDANSSLSAGKENHKMILVDLYTDWCPYCKKLDENTFTDPTLINYLNSKFNCVKAEAQKSSEGKKINKAFQVSHYPCTIIFSESGDYIGKFQGCTNASGYKTMVDNIIQSPEKNSQTNLNTLLASAEVADQGSAGNSDEKNNSSNSGNNSDDGLKSKFNAPGKALLKKFF